MMKEILNYQQRSLGHQLLVLKESDVVVLSALGYFQWKPAHRII